MAPIDILSLDLGSLVTEPLLILKSPELSPCDQRLKTAFAICHIFVISTLLPLAIFIMVTGIRRSQVLLNLFLSLSLNSSINLLMAFSPKYPSRSLCLLSSAGSMAGTALISVAVMVTVLMVWSMLRRASGKKIWMERYFELMLRWLPWIVFVLVLLMNIIYLLIYPEVLYVSAMTCYSENICSTLSHIIAGLGLVAALIFDVWSVIILFHQRRNVGKKTAAEREMEWSLRSADPASTINLPVVGRVVAYSLTTVGALISAVMLYAKPDSHVPAVYQSACGVSCFFVFGTQPDIWKTAHQLLSSGLSSSSFIPSSRTKRQASKTLSLPSFTPYSSSGVGDSETAVTTVLPFFPSPLDSSGDSNLSSDTTIVEGKDRWELSIIHLSNSTNRSVSEERDHPECLSDDHPSELKRAKMMGFAEAMAKLEPGEDKTYRS